MLRGQTTKVEERAGEDKGAEVQKEGAKEGSAQTQGKWGVRGHALQTSRTRDRGGKGDSSDG